MMEKLRIFFIYAWAWTNPRLYRSAMVSEGLMYLLGGEVSMAHQFPPEKQDRNLMAITSFRRRVGIDVEHVHTEGNGCRQGRELAPHLLAQTAARPRGEQEEGRLPAHGI